MSDLSPEVREFLDRSRSVHRATAADRARVKSALQARLLLPSLPPAAPAGTGGSSHAVPLTAAGKAVAVLSTLATKLAVPALVLAGGLGVGAYDRVVLTVQERPQAHVVPSPVVAPAAAPSAAVETSPTPAGLAPVALPVASAPVSAVEDPRSSPAVSSAPAPLDVGGRSAVNHSERTPDRGGTAWPGVLSAAAAAPTGDVAATAPAIAPAMPTETLAREVALLREAKEALGRGDLHDAMARLDEHQTSFPQGTLRQERMATRALTLCALGDPKRATSEVVALQKEAPHSPYADRLRSSCAGWPAR